MVYQIVVLLSVSHFTVDHNWSGYLEDRRPNSAADPYKVAAVIIKTVKTAKV
jgi:glutamine synthetase